MCMTACIEPGTRQMDHATNGPQTNWTAVQLDCKTNGSQEKWTD